MALIEGLSIRLSSAGMTMQLPNLCLGVAILGNSIVAQERMLIHYARRFPKAEYQEDKRHHPMNHYQEDYSIQNFEKAWNHQLEGKAVT
jgi:hypothetical protein